MMQETKTLRQRKTKTKTPVEPKKTKGSKSKSKTAITSLQSVLYALLFAALVGVRVYYDRRKQNRPPNPLDYRIPINIHDVEHSQFRLPATLGVGELLKLIWKDDQTQVDPHGRLVGLPPQLTQRIFDYCQSSGLMDLFRDLLYTNQPQAPGQSILKTLHNNQKWISTTPLPSAYWQNSNLHWVDAADEYVFEETVQVLKEGGFDIVLQALAQEFGSQGLMMAGMGFILVSHLPNGKMHQDMPQSTRPEWFDLLFPLVLPEHDRAHLVLGDIDEPDRYREKTYFTPDVGVLLAGNTYHASGGCDFRATREFRVAVSIYVVDVNAENARMIAEDGTALFPVPGRTDWLLAQQGRFYNASDATVSMMTEQGRSPFVVHDKDERCPQWAAQGECERNLDLESIRMTCLKSCRVFIDDEEYFSKYYNKQN